MPFEGKYCWQIATMGYLSENSPPPLPPPPPLKCLILPYDHSQLACDVWTNVFWETSQPEVRLQVVGAPCLLGTLPPVLLGVWYR